MVLRTIDNKSSDFLNQCNNCLELLRNGDIQRGLNKHQDLYQLEKQLYSEFREMASSSNFELEGNQWLELENYAIGVLNRMSNALDDNRDMLNHLNVAW